MKILVVLLSVLWSVSGAASANEITVSVDIDGREQYIVRQHARIEAKKQALLDFPVMVGGIETLKDGRYREEIEALTVAAVNVEPVSEHWNDNQYRLTARVSIDQNKTLDLVNQLEKDTALRAELKKAYSQLDKLSALADTDKVVDTHIAMFGIKEALLKRDTIAASIAAKEAMQAEVINVMYSAYLLPLLSGHEFVVTNVDEDYVYVEALDNPVFRKKWQDYKRFLSASSYLTKAHDVRTLPSVCVYHGNTLVNTLAGRYRKGEYFNFDYELNRFSERIPHYNNDLLVTGIDQRLSVKLCTF